MTTQLQRKNMATSVKKKVASTVIFIAIKSFSFLQSCGGAQMDTFCIKVSATSTSQIQRHSLEQRFSALKREVSWQNQCLLHKVNFWKASLTSVTKMQIKKSG